MIARWLLVVLAIEAVLLLLLAAWLGASTLPRAALAAFACGGLLALNSAIVGAVYAILRAAEAATQPAGVAKRRHGWRCVLGEWLALFALYVFIQPCERWWLGPDAIGPMAPGRMPVLLVHGYLCNRGWWWWLRRQLRARQFAIATVNLEPPLGGIDLLARQLAQRVDALLAETGAPQVVLVTHSMGGLVARAYVQASAGVDVAHLVTLAAPHHGTSAARLGCGRNAQQMRPHSRWLRQCNAQPSPAVPITSIWTVDDELVVPPDSSRLAGAHETVLAGLGHMALAFSPTLLARLVEELAQGRARSAAHDERQPAAPGAGLDSDGDDADSPP